MSMLRTIGVTFLVFIAGSVHAQLTLKLRVADAELGPVSNARVILSFGGNEFQGRTSPSGYFIHDIPDALPIALQATHAAYADMEYSLTRRDLRRENKDTVYLNLEMEFRELSPFTVRPDAPDTVFGSERISVADYAFLNDGRMLLLTYERNIHKETRVLLCDADQEILSGAILPDEPIQLRQHFRGQVSVECKNGLAYLVLIDQDDISLIEWDMDFYENQLKPIVDSVAGFYLHSNYSDVIPAFEYFAYSQRDSINFRVHSIIDKQTMELYRAEYKYLHPQDKLWAYRQELRTGVDKEIWAGARFFTSSLYYKPVYAPLFVQGEHILIFDHYRDQVVSYDTSFQVVDSSGIAYHKVHGNGWDWQESLIQDRNTKEIYTTYLKDGYMHLLHINPLTGETSETLKLHFRYPEHVTVRDGVVYYIYRPFESIQKKFLYAEELAVTESFR